MTVEQYLRMLNIDTMMSGISLNFVIGEVVGEGHNKDFAYHDSPVRSVSEWFEGGVLDKYIVLNTKQPTISWMSGANWNPIIERNHQMSLLVVTREELDKKYSKEQGDHMIEFIDKIIKENIGNNPWLQEPKEEESGVLQVCSRESDKIAEVVKDALKKGREVVWTCGYDTFYGVSWYDWVKKQLENVKCTINVKGYNKFHDYVDKVKITPIK